MTALDLSLHKPTRATSEAHRNRIARYYDSTQVLYSHLWSPTGVHYGLWDNGTTRHQDAIRNLDRRVANSLELRPGSAVLDAGCGVGGTSCFLARTNGFAMTGITLSTDQLRRARVAAMKLPPSARPSFRIADYHDTGLPSESFDGIFGIESICYSEDKRSFLNEAFRLLRPGGRLVVADGFRRGVVPDRFAPRYRRLLDGMALLDLAEIDEFRGALDLAGFASVHVAEERHAILPSARRIARLSRIGTIVCTAGSALRITPEAWLMHGHAGLAQLPLFESGVLTYCIVSATKASPAASRPAGRTGGSGARCDADIRQPDARHRRG